MEPEAVRSLAHTFSSVVQDVRRCAVLSSSVANLTATVFFFLSLLCGVASPIPQHQHQQQYRDAVSLRFRCTKLCCGKIQRVAPTQYNVDGIAFLVSIPLQR